MNKIKNINIIEFMILLMPIIDVLNTITNISLSLYIRGLFLIILLFIFLFKTHTKYKKVSFIFLSLLGLTSVIYLGHYFTINGTYYLINEITTLVKFLYLPVLTTVLINIYEENKFNISKTIMRITMLYVILTFIPSLLDIGLPSYSYGKLGNSGLFYSPNELGSILSILSPFLIFNIFKKPKKVINYILALLFIMTCFILGTKAPIIGLALSLLGSLVITTLNTILNKKGLANILISIFLVVFSLFIYNFSYLKYNLTYQEDEYETKEENNNPATNELLANDEFINFPVNKYGVEITDHKLLNLIFSSRNVYLSNNLAKYNNSNLTSKIYGLTLGATKNNNGISNMSELDFCDIFVYYGLLGAITLIPYIIILFIFMFLNFFKKFKTNLQDYELVSMCLSFGIGLAIALTAGHTLSAPAVSTILAMPMLYLIYKFNLVFNPKINLKSTTLAFSTILIISIIIIIPNYHKSYNLNINLNDKLTFNEKVIKVDKKSITYDNISDTLTYYMPESLKDMEIIHGERTFNDTKIDFFTILNDTNTKVNLKLTLNTPVISEVSNSNSVYLTTPTNNILVSNTYHYLLNTKDTVIFNKYPVKTLLSKTKDYSIQDNELTKEITIEPHSSIDTYFVNSPTNLITNKDYTSWLSFNGIYTESATDLYTKNLNLDFTDSPYDEFLFTNYIMNISKYSNYLDNIWYQDYDLNTNSKTYEYLYKDLCLTYHIYQKLATYNVNQDLFSEFATKIKESFNAEEYTKTTKGIYFNIFDKTFKNQIGLINILLEYLKTNKDSEISEITSLLIAELENPKWLENNQIHEYLSDGKYQGTITDKEILPNLTILKTNLEANGYDSTIITKYLTVLNQK